MTAAPSAAALSSAASASLAASSAAAFAARSAAASAASAATAAAMDVGGAATMLSSRCATAGRCRSSSAPPAPGSFSSAATKPLAADRTWDRVDATFPPKLADAPRRRPLPPPPPLIPDSSSAWCRISASAATAMAAYAAPIFSSEVCTLVHALRRRWTHGLRSSQYRMCAFTLLWRYFGRSSVTPGRLISRPPAASEAASLRPTREAATSSARVSSAAARGRIACPSGASTPPFEPINVPITPPTSASRP